MFDDGTVHMIEKWTEIHAIPAILSQDAADVVEAWVPVGEASGTYTLQAMRAWVEEHEPDPGRYRVFPKFEEFGAQRMEEFDVTTKAEYEIERVSHAQPESADESGPQGAVPMSAVPTPEDES